MTDDRIDTARQIQRGFEQLEFEERTIRAQVAMRTAQLDALLLTTEPEIRYFTGFHTQFFESPTRPWFVVVPATSRPIAVIPEIGATGMQSTWIEDVRTWPSPQPEDDGISLLANALNALPSRFGRLGVPLGTQSVLRMPAADYESLAQRIPFTISDCALLLHQLRFIKSPAEIKKIAMACEITSNAFLEIAQTSSPGESEIEICRRMKIDLLERGADSIPYLVAGSGLGGYGSIIMGPTDRLLSDGDVLIIDTGTTYDGYFCDFDRNLAFGRISDDTRKAHEVIFNATDAGFSAAHPGATTSEVWAAMWKELEEGGALGNSVGRMGHGLGMQLTEWPSVKPGDSAVLEPGVVLTLEPGMEFTPGKQLVHEENIVITEEGAQYLSHRAPQEMPIAGV
jgi:Xaa-Pro aminopeptidase